MKYDMVIMQSKLNILRKVLSEICGIRGINAVLLAVSKLCAAGIRSDIYEPFWFKLGVMTDTTELYILILIYNTLTLYKVKGMQKSKTCFANYL